MQEKETNGSSGWPSAARTGKSTPRAIQELSDCIVDGALHGFGFGQAVLNATIMSNLYGIQHFVHPAGGNFPLGHPQTPILLWGVARHQKTPVSVALLETCLQYRNLHDTADQAI